MLPDTKRRLYHSIVAFLKSECLCSDYSADVIESLEVAKQCLENAFEVSGDQPPESDLLPFFEKYINGDFATTNTPTTHASKRSVPRVTPENMAMAENLKTQGNSCMIVEKFQEAIACYSRSIELDPTNAVYYCNRAAAHCRLNNNDECVLDCERAIEIDPSYSKAYGRMGLAYSNKGDFIKAIESYKKAISLDPDNSNFKQNLAIAESQLKRSSSQSSTGGSSGFGPGGGFDLNALLNNPMMQGLTQRLMTDPQMQNTVSSMMQGIFRDSGTRTEGNNTTPEAPSSMEDVLRFGQQMAQQMQQSNPELVDALRQQMQNIGGQPPARDNNDDNGSPT